jgi:hypothetical protein
MRKAKMRKANWTPSIVPKGEDHNTYLVVDDLGCNRQARWEVSTESADRETVILDLLQGQYKNPVRVFAFNTVEGWSQDVSTDVAHELRRRCLQLRDVPSSVRDFVRCHKGHDRQQSTLRLV